MGSNKRGANQWCFRGRTTRQILIFAQEIDDSRFGQCANSHGQTDAGANESVAEARDVYFLFADLFAPFERCRNRLAQTEIRMAQRGRLYFQRASAICGQAGIMGIWKEFENKVFKLQNRLN